MLKFDTEIYLDPSLSKKVLESLRDQKKIDYKTLKISYLRKRIQNLEKKFQLKLNNNLKKGGQILITVPAYKFLFSMKDITLGHYRRYNKGQIIKLFEKFKLIRSHGMTSLSYQRFKGHATKYDIKSLGYNYRMDDIRASIGIVQLEKLDEDIIKRAELRKLYLEKLKNNSKIIIPFKSNENFVSNYIFPIVLNNLNREEIRDRLHKKSIQTSIHYPSIHQRMELHYQCTVPLKKMI